MHVRQCDHPVQQPPEPRYRCLTRVGPWPNVDLYGVPQGSSPSSDAVEPDKSLLLNASKGTSKAFPALRLRFPAVRQRVASKTIGSKVTTKTRNRVPDTRYQIPASSVCAVLGRVGRVGWMGKAAGGGVRWAGVTGETTAGVMGGGYGSDGLHKMECRWDADGRIVYDGSRWILGVG